MQWLHFPHLIFAVLVERKKMCSNLNLVALKQKQVIKLTLGRFSRQNAAFFLLVVVTVLA